ncbi:MAG: hypothetical protein ABS81_10205 [Pseudonocardia sp. SCN 72-86]|nr:MAG: hypothetical protein ABS81_10205 [Pseudonocardia sp. SCN 72-86]
MTDSLSGQDQWATLENEFATVHVTVDRSANGPTLVILDPASGREIALDPLELQTLAWARHEHLAELLAPAFKEQYLRRVTPAEFQKRQDVQ